MASQQGNAKMTWNHEADMALIRAVLEVIPVGSYQIRDIALKMEELGYTCSVKAVSQHLQKLKKKDSGSAGTGHVTSGGKVGKASTPKKAATPMKRGARKGKQADVDLLTDDSESPLESKASCKVKKEHRMKEEPDSDDDKKGAFGDMGRGGGNAGALAQGVY